MSKLSLGVQKATALPVQHENSLVLLDNATRMLAEARTLDEVRQVRDLAEAARVYAKKHHLGLEAQKHAGVIAVEATIRQGEILAQMAEAGLRAGLGQGKRTDIERLDNLSDLGTTRREASDAQAMAADAEAVREWAEKATEVSPSVAARVARTAKAKRLRDAKLAAAPTLPPSCDIRFGDFREVLADVPDGSVDVVLTDPPYPAEFLPLWRDLAVFSARVLRPGGLLVAMSGQTHLPAVIEQIGESLPYRWVVAYLAPGGSYRSHARNVASQWKPVLVYGGTERTLFDVVRSESEDKEHHGWGQSETGIAALLRMAADPGAVICDPFVGGGTTAVVALAYGCSFVGAEIDREAYDTALARLAP